MPILPHVFGDHPRGCGAHYGTRKRARCLLGSSPRVRGSPVVVRRDIPARGIIPAGAGLTRSGRRPHRHHRDHPRGCGAHISHRVIMFYLRGSSPRVRGSRRAGIPSRSPHGIIPAGAGLTHHLAVQSARFWDHPRGCGAHTCVVLPGSPAGGSSPRVRGSLCI